MSCESPKEFPLKTFVVHRVGCSSPGDFPHHRAGAGAEPLRQIHGARLGGSHTGDGEAGGGAMDSLQGGSLLLGSIHGLTKKGKSEPETIDLPMKYGIFL